MEVHFKDEALRELYLTGKTKDRKYVKVCRNKKLADGFRKAVDIMRDVDVAAELKYYSFLHYEQLRYNGTSSVRIVNGMVERLIFTETSNGLEVELIEIDSTHYGSR